MLKNKYNIAVVGATGLIGRTFLKVLSEYSFPIGTLRIFASDSSEGKLLNFKDTAIAVERLSERCFKNTDIVFFSAGKQVSLDWAEKAEKDGALVIDNSSAFRMKIGVPLTVPEINVCNPLTGRIIACPDSVTIQCVLPLSALNAAYGLKRVNYCTYESVSGSGKKGVSDLFKTEYGFTPNFYPYNISKTCIPKIGEFSEYGYTEKEIKIINETKKILRLPKLKVSATCIRVPVEKCHGVTVSAEFVRPYNLAEVFGILKKQKSLKVLEIPEIPLSVTAAGSDTVYVGRIRNDVASKNGIIFYAVADNTRKGSATNAVQIALKLIEDNLL